MRVRFTGPARSDYNALDSRVQRLVKKQLRFLVDDLRHRSFNAKKYDQTRDIWQARVDRSYRFFCLIEGDAYVIIRIQPHPKRRARL